MHLEGMNIGVVGAGIAGLATAAAFARCGARVTVLERAAALKAVGAGIQIAPNGAAVLKALGVQHRAAELGTPLHAVQMRDGLSDRLVLHLDLDRAGYPHPYRAFHRADLIDILAKAARAAGATITLGTDVMPQDLVSDTGAIAIPGSAGQGQRVEMLVGADGLRSGQLTDSPAGPRAGLRSHILGPETPRFTHHVAWRATVPLLPDDTLATDVRGKDCARIYMAPGRHLVCYPLRARGLMNIVAVEERDDWLAEGWMQQTDPDTLRAAFAGMCGPVRALLDRVEVSHIWGLFRHPVPPVWHRGAVGLIGDAVHPTLPFLAQGGNLALEDAWELPRAVQTAPTPQDAWSAFNAKRLARVRRAVAAADANARLYHMGAGPLRTGLLGAMRLAGGLAPGLPLRKFDWLYRYDVTAPD